MYNFHRYQNDSYNCGIWTLYIVEVWGDYLATNGDQGDFLQYLHNHALARELLQRRSGDTLRREYKGRYHNAKPSDRQASQNTPHLKPTKTLIKVKKSAAAKTNPEQVHLDTMDIQYPEPQHSTKTDREVNAMREPPQNQIEKAKPPHRKIKSDPKQPKILSFIPKKTKSLQGKILHEMTSTKDLGSQSSEKDAMPQATADEAAGKSTNVQAETKGPYEAPCPANPQQNIEEALETDATDPTTQSPISSPPKVRKKHRTNFPNTSTCETPTPSPIEQLTPETKWEDRSPNGLTVLTWNVMGLTTVQDELSHLLEQHRPDIVILTETKLVEQQHSGKWLKEIFPGYTLQCSSRPAKNPLRGKERVPARSRIGMGGVIIAVKKELTGRGSLTRLNTNPSCKGYMIGVNLNPLNSTPIRIWGVYMPTADLATRRLIYSHLEQELNTHPAILTIVAGDWNAVLHPTDRSSRSLTPLDQEHINFVHAQGLASISPPPPNGPNREPTFHSYAESDTQSKIDDILVNTAFQTCLKSTPASHETIWTTHDTDHLPVQASIPVEGFQRPVPEPPARPQPPKFKTPMLATELAIFHQRTQLELATEIQLLSSKTERIIAELDQKLLDENSTTGKYPQPPTKNVLKNRGINGKEIVDDPNNDLQILLEMALKTAQETCTMDQPHSTGTRKSYFSRRIGRKYKKLLKINTQLRKALVLYKCQGASQSFQEAASQVAALEIPQGIPALTLPEAPPDKESQRLWSVWAEQANEALSTCLAIRKQLKETGRKKLRDKYGSALRKLLAQRPKVAHKIINKGFQDRQDLTTIRDPSTGDTLQDPEAILRYTHEYFAKQATPVAGPKTGAFLPTNAPRKYPWNTGTTTGLDPFEIQTRVGDTRLGSVDLLGMLRDKANFHNILRFTSNNKQPGPDEIPNELLKNLPDQLQTCIHNMFIIQWLVGYTPDGWKESNTVLLYKKGDPLDLKNYRPIALANTLYKLWTSMLTEVLSKYAETYDILSNSQEGFRQHRNTIRQIQNVQNILSDARLTNRNLFLLYIDFSSAFNTIDHDKLLQTMHDLGFPEDAIYVIQDLYNNATTKAKLTIGTTEPIQINRGTIQGDTLSPLLFTIFLEPLLRWLQVGGRGYRYGSLQASPEHKDLTTSNAAYADDLLMMTNSHLDLRTQAEKVEAFCTWSGLELNLGKCGITGVLYQDAASGLISHPYRREIDMIKNRTRLVKFKGQEFPFHHPDTQPYTYLGIELTPTMNQSFQQTKVLQEVLRRGENILNSSASPLQKLQFIQRCIKPYAQYSFPLAAYNIQSIQKLDSVIARIAKKSLRLPISTPNAMVFTETNHAGMGVQSLLVDYIQLNTAYLVRALNDEGPLGIISRALLQMQHQHLGGINPLRTKRANNRDTQEFFQESRHCHLALQLSLAKLGGLDVKCHGECTMPAHGYNLEKLHLL